MYFYISISINRFQAFIEISRIKNENNAQNKANNQTAIPQKLRHQEKLDTRFCTKQHPREQSKETL